MLILVFAHGPTIVEPYQGKEKARTSRVLVQMQI